MTHSAVRYGRARVDPTNTRWQVWIDRGGTFTDAIGVRGDIVRTAKVLSGAGSVVGAVRALLDLAPDAVVPPIDLRLGTTLATNALLERRGAPTALAITAGLGDLLAIGDQTRPDLFALDITRPAPLYARVLELATRADPTGRVLARDDHADLLARFTDVVAAGIDSFAIVVLHGWAAPDLEQEVAKVARLAGARHVSTSADASAELGLLGRARTAVADAYLSPVLAAYLADLRAALPGSTVRLMQSSGGLADAARLRGRDAVLSGPAGGAIAAAHAAVAAGAPHAVGFDMGGTSTDVTCVEAGQLDRTHETEVAGTTLRAPAIAIHTVAAGGGSICQFDGLRLTVGPASAGAEPGPICYGAGGTAITVTDVDLVLGRLADDHFPWPLDRAAAIQALAAVGRALGVAGDDEAAARQAAEGFFAIANANMAEAVREVTIARGKDVREHALVVFGGAGGMHAGPVARQLGVRRVIVPRFAGLLSAWGIGLAPVTWHGEVDGGRVAVTADALATVAQGLNAVEATGRAAVAAEGATRLRVARTLSLRYRGSDTALDVSAGDATTVGAAFAEAHRARFGYVREDAIIEIAAGRVEVIGEDVAPTLPMRGQGPLPAPRRIDRGTPVYGLTELPAGAVVTGPALVLDPHASVVVDPGWVARVGDGGELVMDDREPPRGAPNASRTANTDVDPVRLEVYGNLMMSIAAQMGVVLERTAVSVNIRERRDFSCAVFDARGGLVANAPHIPVHLGAMGETVRSLLDSVTLTPGAVYACNDPSAGGSHLPDITVITPVHDGHRLIYLVANRGHHADVGGLTPGSMPPMSRTLEEEGVALRHLPIVIAGRLQRDEILDALRSGPWPARRPEDNLADLEAQIAANHAGVALMSEAMARASQAEVLAYLGHVQDQAAALVGRAIGSLRQGTRHFADQLDDGSPIVATVTVAGSRLHIDFTGSAPAHVGNLNAPRAVTVAAVIYVLRAMCGAPIPLNAGCLVPVDLVIPPGSILDPPPGAAVVAGNVETSQRIVDVLLGALELAAASQGTMNNLTLGGPTWAYYETIGGGAGATARAPGASAVHTHMTNTRITDPEVLEARLPVRLRRFAVRVGSGGTGLHRGGDGIVRELELLAPAEIALVTERRTTCPFGLAGGQPGRAGRNLVDGAEVPGRAHVRAGAGTILTLETPGGGGWGPTQGA